MNNLTAYRITYADGTISETNMAADVTLAEAEKYYLGNKFDLGCYPKENLQTAIKVEQIGSEGGKP